jgi:hypothetical protein
MIKHNGYYVSLPFKVTDSRSKDIWFSRKAFFFKKKEVLWANKYFNNQIDNYFTKDDFKLDGYNGYNINGKEISILKYKDNPVLETKIFMTIISENEIKYRDSDGMMKFVHWEDE